MIPISVDMVMKVLDQIPAWRAVRDLPDRLSDIERRIGEVENKLAALEREAGYAAARACPSCGASMAVESEIPDPRLGRMGVKLQTLQCPKCGHKAEKQFSPEHGYL